MYNIRDGFRIEDPDVFVPWDTDEKGLESLLGQYGLRKVKGGYYCISCKSLGGVEHELGFHFESPDDKAKTEELEKYVRSMGKIVRKVGPHHDPIREGKIRELEFFRKEYPDLRGSFEEFQSALEKGFGKPTRSSLEETGFTSNEWELEGVKIWHRVIDRFGLEEHVRMRKT